VTVRSVFVFPVTAALFALAATVNAQGKLYRWVDDDGVVHYTDHVPPESSHQDREILNHHGIAVGFEQGELTEEERAEVARLDEEEAEKVRQRNEAAARDRILLDTYLSVQEIEDLRDRRLDLLDSQIKVTDIYLQELRDRLATLHQEASRYSPYSDRPDAAPVPEHLSTDISRTTASINLYEQNLDRTRKERERVRVAFGSDIDRFKQLKGED
jgi:hypothetical protein